MSCLRIAAALSILSVCSCDRLPPAASEAPPSTYHRQSFSLNDAEAIQGASVTSAFFPATKIQPLVGRVFLPEEYRAAKPPVTVIGNRLWKRTFGGDPAAIGREIRLNNRGFTIVGIMPASFESPAGAEIWVPAEK